MGMLETISKLLELWQRAEPSVKVFTSMLALTGVIGWLAALFDYSPERRPVSKALNITWLYRK